mmetsp:Transcript_18362/g.56078  ORF Transcript_18362/g.56078 Transcript_18362/m.56078 type:complete len:252 (+) Transcript_18362:907-1662(+)
MLVALPNLRHELGALLRKLAGFGGTEVSTLEVGFHLLVHRLERRLLRLLVTQTLFLQRDLTAKRLLLLLLPHALLRERLLERRIRLIGLPPQFLGATLLLLQPQLLFLERLELGLPCEAILLLGLEAQSLLLLALACQLSEALLLFASEALFLLALAPALFLDAPPLGLLSLEFLGEAAPPLLLLRAPPLLLFELDARRTPPCDRLELRRALDTLALLLYEPPLVLLASPGEEGLRGLVDDFAHGGNGDAA